MGVGYNPKIVTDGLVLCLDAGNKKSYPGSGSNFYDLSHSKNHGTNNLTTFDSSNNAMYYDNTVACATTIASDSSINFSDPKFTVSVWVKLTTPPNITTTYNIVSKKERYNNTRKGWMVQYDFRTPGILALRLGDGVSVNDATPNPTVNTWSTIYQTDNFVNVTMVNDTSNTVFYMNGTAVGAGLVSHGTYSSLDDPATLNIGDSPMGSDTVTPMKVGAVHIYNRKLTPSEVLQNFNALRGRFSL